jgi:beta-galactosidase
MENSLGNFYKYIEGFEKNDHMCGGFIWDFADQTMRRTGFGSDEWLYGDDFKEIYSKAGFKKKFRTGGDGIFCANGIFSADRTPHPAVMEVKKGYQVLHVESVEGSQNDFLVVNNQMFSDLSGYRLFWRLERNGEYVMEGEVPSREFVGTPPGGSAPFRLEEVQLEALRLDDVQHARGEGEFTLLFSFTQSADTAWAKAGYEQAFSQVLFAPAGVSGTVKKTAAIASLRSERENETLLVTGNNFSYTFEHGVLSSLKTDEAELLCKPVIPNLWRAPTDNDNGHGNFFKPAIKFMSAVKWMNAGARQSPLYWHKRDTDDGIEVVSEWKHPLCSKLHIICTVFPDGSLEIDMRVIPKRIDAVRIGLQFVLAQDFDKVSWYGRGPHENYPDRKLGARISKFSTTIENLGHDYVRPQENGARCDVRKLTVSSEKRSITIRDFRGAGLIFSAWHYEQEDLAAATHGFALARKPLTTLNVDSAMQGVGGDLPGFTALYEEFKLKGKKEYYLQIGLDIK